MSAPIKVSVAGSGGKMGLAVIDAVRADKALALAATFDVGDDAAKAIAACEVVVDFTRPEGTLMHLEHCLKTGKGMVIGTTGFSDSQKKTLAEAAKRIPIVLSPNFAVGVNAVFKLAETAAGILGDGYDIEIIEAHHRHKVDAPSGTALKLGEIIAGQWKRSLKEDAKHGREGDVGARPGKEIGFHAIRGGDIVGEHTVVFAGTGERIEVTHRSASRATYAQGALRSARFLMDKPNGFYDMQDVLGLR